MLPWQPFLAFYIWGAHWRHLKNMTEPSICGGDAALCQITLTTCHQLVSARYHQQSACSMCNARFKNFRSIQIRTLCPSAFCTTSRALTHFVGSVTGTVTSSATNLSSSALQSSNWTSDLFSTYSYIFNVNYACWHLIISRIRGLAPLKISLINKYQHRIDVQNIQWNRSIRTSPENTSLV